MAWLGVTSGSYNGLSGNNRQEILDQNNKHSLQSLNPKKKKYMLIHVYIQDRLTTLELYHKQWQLQGEQKISFLLRGGGGSGGHSGGLNAMIDGLHHKLATIGAPSRLLQQPSFPEKKTRAPIHFPCLFVDSPAKLVTTYILLSRQLYSSPICYFFLHNRGMFLYVVQPNCINFGFKNPTIQ